jgi:PadR family transcriptional regulator, regulatory protein PadR
MPPDKPDVLHGSLVLMVLRTLDSMGPQHGWGIARRIEQTSGDVLELNQGSLYPALLRLEQLGWIAAEWGTSENNRRAKFYSITRAGKKQLAAETENWERISGILGRFLRPGGASS